MTEHNTENSYSSSSVSYTYVKMASMLNYASAVVEWCESQARIKKEGNAKHLCYDIVLLNSEYHHHHQRRRRIYFI